MASRRTILRATLATIALASTASRVQGQTRPRRIGFLLESTQADYVLRIDAFKVGMRELGYAEGRDYTIDQRSAQNDLARLPALAEELLSLSPALIFASSTPTAVAAHKATRDVPILVAQVSDPVGSGLAASLRRPGGNVTGLTNLGTELNAKRLDLLRQCFPGIRRVAFLYNPHSADAALALRQFESAAEKLQIRSIAAPVRKAEEIAAAFDKFQTNKAQALVVTQGQWLSGWLGSISEHAAKHRLPVVIGSRGYVEAGGLLSYTANSPDLYRRAAAYVDKIFKGAKPADLPIEQPNKFELVVNLKTAKALGITIPQSILVSADRVIE